MNKLILPILLTYLTIPLSTVTLAHQKQSTETVKILPLAQIPNTEDIQERDSQARSLAEIAWESGQYHKAYQIIQTISDTSQQIQALRDLAKAYLAVGQQKQAAKIILQAVKLAPKDDLSDLYYWVGDLFATGEAEEGKALLKTIADNEYILASSHYSIAESYLNIGQYNQAFNYGKLIPGQILLPLPEYQDPKVELFNKIIDKSLKSGQAKLALQVATALDEKDDRVYALQTIAEYYHKNGNKKQAIVILDIALSIAKTIKSISVIPERSLFWIEPNASILVNLANNYMELGEKSKALEILSIARESVNNFENQYAFDIPVWRKSNGFRQISNSYLKLGEKNKAKELLAQSLVESETIQDNFYKIQELLEIAKDYQEIGEGNPSAEILEKIIALVETIERESDKISFLMTIQNRFREIGKKERGEAIFKKTISLIENIESESEKISYLIPIVTTYISANQKEKASQLARRILSMIQGLDSQDSRRIKLDELVVNCLEKDDPTLALQIIQRIPATENRARMLFAIALRYANLGNSTLASQFLSQGLASVDSIIDKQERDMLLAQTARNISSIYYISSQNPLVEPWRYNLATQLVNAISNPQTKAEMLIDIAIQYRKLGEIKISNRILDTAFAVGKTIEPKEAWQTKLLEISNVGIQEEEYDLVLQFVKKIEDASYQTVILRQIAQKYQIEGNKKKAEEILAQGIEVANRIEDESGRQEALVGISEQQNGW